MQHTVRVLAVGDQHFKTNNIQDIDILINDVVSITRRVKPDFVVLLGDLLDRHNIVDIIPFNKAIHFIDLLSKESHVYLLIGNHDYINNQQFLTENHAFNALKKWKNVTVVDRVVCKTVKEMDFVFVPYVPPGRFEEALETTVEQQVMWEYATCIFAHQEFYGVKFKMCSSTKGDKWDAEYPYVISGHIHSEQQVGTNIYYVGSSLQASFSELGVKHVWEVIFTGTDETISMDYKRHKLSIKSRKVIRINVNDINDNIYNDISDDYHNKLVISGTTSQIAAFSKSTFYNELKQHVDKIDFKATLDVSNVKRIECLEGASIKYIDVLSDLVNKENEMTRNMFKMIFTC